MSKLSKTQYRLAAALVKLNAKTGLEQYEFKTVCPYDVVEILNLPKFDEWIWTVVPEGDYKFTMYITGNTKMRGIFDLWHGTLKLMKDE